MTGLNVLKRGRPTQGSGDRWLEAIMHIRDLREKKNLSQDKVAEAAGLSYSAFVRIEEGRGTQQEWEHVVATIKKMPPGLRKLGGKPFKDPVKQQAVREARARGRSVAKAMGLSKPGRRQYVAKAS